MQSLWAFMDTPRDAKRTQTVPKVQITVLQQRACAMKDRVCPKCGGRMAPRRCKVCWTCHVEELRKPEIPGVVVVEGERCRRIPISKTASTIVDEDAFNLWNWWNLGYSRSDNGLYACIWQNSQDGKRECFMLHKLITGAGIGEEADHKNHDTLDNRRSNLRKSTRLQNTFNTRIGKRNTSGYKGVSLRKKWGKWVATTKVNSKGVYLGAFDNPEDAARAYDKFMYARCPEFAVLNFPDEVTSCGPDPCL